MRSKARHDRPPHRPRRPRRMSFVPQLRAAPLDRGPFRNAPHELRLLADPEPPDPVDPAAVMLTCANCGAQMIERRCKLICQCGYFLSCSDYY